MSIEESIQAFVSRQKHLLELELRSEQEEDAKKNKSKDDDSGGFFLRNVDVLDTSVGLYGRTVVAFGSNKDKGQDSGNPKSDSRRTSSRRMLHAHRLTVGDEVEILPKNGKGVLRANEARGRKKTKRIGGVICAVDDFTI